MARQNFPDMSLLSDIPWKLKYSPEEGSLLKTFYLPALARAVRYDRSTGYFKASALAAAAKGVEGLIRNRGRMRLIVGCTLDKPEADAISEGQSLREAVEANLLATPLSTDDPKTIQALELLAWMVARGHLDVKVAVPCDPNRKPVTGQTIYHEKAGIIEDAAGDRIAFNGSVNESESGWTGNFDSFHLFTSWGPASDHVEAEAESFGRLWADQAKTAIVIDVPSAVRDELLKFLPEGDRLPVRLEFGKRPPRGMSIPRLIRPRNRSNRTPTSPFRRPFRHPISGKRSGLTSTRLRPFPAVGSGSAKPPAPSRPGPTRCGPSTGCTTTGRPGCSSPTRWGSERPSRPG